MLPGFAATARPGAVASLIMVLGDGSKAFCTKDYFPCLLLGIASQTRSLFSTKNAEVLTAPGHPGSAAFSRIQH